MNQGCTVRVCHTLEDKPQKSTISNPTQLRRFFTCMLLVQPLFWVQVQQPASSLTCSESRGTPARIRKAVTQRPPKRSDALFLSLPLPVWLIIPSFSWLNKVEGMLQPKRKGDLQQWHLAHMRCGPTEPTPPYATASEVTG